MKILFLFFLLPLQILGQDITGVWTGTLYNDTTKQFIKYEIAISEYNGKLSGYSHTIYVIDSVENIGVKSISIKNSRDEFIVEDDKLVYNNYTAPPAKGVKTYSKLLLSQNDSALILSGPWHTNKTKIYNSLTGNIFLQKKREIKRTLIIPKLENLGLADALSFINSQSTTQNLSNAKKSILNSSEPKDQVTGLTKGVGSNAIEPKILKAQQADKKIEVSNQNSTEGLKKAESASRDIALNKASSRIADKSFQKNKTTDTPSSKFQNPKNDINPENRKKIGKEILIKDTSAVQKEIPKKLPSAVAAIPTPSQRKENSKIITTEIKSVSKPAAELSLRKIETIKSVEIKQDSLILSLFDNGTIDGDTVSVLLNGQVIIARQGLTLKAINKTIYLTPEMGDSLVLIMYAENLGSIPPNTGLLVIHDGDDIFEIRFTGDMQKNSAIILKRKKKQ